MLSLTDGFEKHDDLALLRGVILSLSDGFIEGETVTSRLGMQSLSITDGSELTDTPSTEKTAGP